MIRVLCCWELGGGYGHLFRLLPIGKELAKRGCQVVYALKDSTRAEPFLRDHAHQIISAPSWHAPPKRHPLSQTYAQNLLRNGYWHRDALSDQLEGWLTLFETWQPNVILAEHAPAALLAARKANLPRVAIGTGFSLPPLESPMPGLQSWFALPEHYLKTDERNFLDCVNPVLQDLAIAPLSAVSEIFEGAPQVLCTFPELDHYGARSDARYWGPVIWTPQDDQPAWHSNRRENIFVYLNPSYRFFYPIINWLKAKQLPAVLFAPGLDQVERQSLETNRLSIVSHPANLQTAATHCRWMISHGGHNTLALMLLAGVPSLICPTQLEQAALAQRLCARHLAAALNYFDSNPDIESKLESAFMHASNDELANFANKYTGFNSAHVVEDIVEFILRRTR